MKPTASAEILVALLVASAVALTPGRAIAQNYEQQLKAVCSSLGTRLISQKKTTAAVVDFTDLSGNVTALGRFLAEELSGCLVSETTELQVVERLRLSAVLREQKLGESPVIDPDTAKKLGEVVGAQVIITGTLTSLGDTVRLSTRALDVSTARVIGAASADIPKTRAIEELLTRDTEAGKQRTEGQSAGTTGSEVPKTGSAAAPTWEGQQQVVRGITWRLMDCQKSVGRVTCRVEVSHSQNGELTIQLMRATALDNHSNDAQSSFGYGIGNFLRLAPGASEIVRFAFESGASGRGRTSSTNRLGEDATELASIQLDFGASQLGRDRFFVRFQRVPIR